LSKWVKTVFLEHFSDVSKMLHKEPPRTCRFYSTVDGLKKVEKKLHFSGFSLAPDDQDGKIWMAETEMTMSKSTFRKILDSPRNSVSAFFLFRKGAGWKQLNWLMMLLKKLLSIMRKSVLSENLAKEKQSFLNLRKKPWQLCAINILVTNKQQPLAVPFPKFPFQPDSFQRNCAGGCFF